MGRTLAQPSAERGAEELIGAEWFDAIDDEHAHRPFGRVELEAELFLRRREDGGAVRIGRRRSRGPDVRLADAVARVAELEIPVATGYGLTGGAGFFFGPGFAPLLTRKSMTD